MTMMFQFLMMVMTLKYLKNFNQKTKQIGENTSEHSEEFNLEDYLNYCNSHPLDEDNEDEDDEYDDKPSKKIKKNQEDEEDIIISSKDLKDKKATQK